MLFHVNAKLQLRMYVHQCSNWVTFVDLNDPVTHQANTR